MWQWQEDLSLQDWKNKGTKGRFWNYSKLESWIETLRGWKSSQQRAATMCLELVCLRRYNEVGCGGDRKWPLLLTGWRAIVGVTWIRTASKQERISPFSLLSPSCLPLVPSIIEAIKEPASKGGIQFADFYRQDSKAEHRFGAERH